MSIIDPGNGNMKSQYDVIVLCLFTVTFHNNGTYFLKQNRYCKIPIEDKYKIYTQKHNA